MRSPRTTPERPTAKRRRRFSLSIPRNFRDGSHVFHKKTVFFGGTFLKVEFVDRRDAVYVAWMYRYANGTWVVCRFQQTTCSTVQLEWINGRYREVLDFAREFNPQ